MLRQRLHPPAALLFLAILSARRLSDVDAAAGDRTVQTVLSPVKDLEPSLAASAAQGTAVAVVADAREESRSSSDRDDVRKDGSDRGGRHRDECGWEGGGECAVILTRSPIPDAASNLTASVALAERPPRSSFSRTGVEEVDASDVDDDDSDGAAQKSDRLSLIPLPRGPVAASAGGGPPSRILHVLHESAGTVCALTGFASDVRHLVRVAAREVSDREYVYGGAPPAVHCIVRDVLASRVRGAAFAASGRPFGVQALVVGNRFAPGNRLAGEEGSRNTLQVYTVDPAGGWRHWGGGGTAVGRKADVVRRKLHEALQHSRDDDSHDEESPTRPGLCRPRNWSEALDVAMRSLIESTEMDDEGHWKRWNDDSNNIDDELMGGQFDAVVVLGGRFDQFVQNRCFAVDSEMVKDSYLRCRRAIATSKMERPGWDLTSLS